MTTVHTGPMKWHEAKQEAASNGANDFKNDVTQQAS